MSLTVDGIKVVPTIFPDKTSQVWKLPLEELKGNMIVIVWDFESEAEFLHLAQLKMLLSTKCQYQKTLLIIRYLPYARQDKAPSNESTFALHAFLPLLASLAFDTICLCDPHSGVAKRILDDLGAVAIDYYPIDLVNKAAKGCEIDLFCYPDAGALEKYSRLYTGHDYIYGRKVRDQLTGRIEKYDLETNGQGVSGKNVLIVDDLCDAGGTFILLAKELISKGASKVVLFVSHGLFTKGTEVLFESGISRIFTIDGEVQRQQSP
jgi:ribose-phosphate pyrophosphokinase